MGTVQFTMLQTGGGDQTLVGWHVVSTDLGIYPVLQVNERDSLAAYICFAVFDNSPLSTVGKLQASEKCYVLKHTRVLCSESGVLIDFFIYFLTCANLPKTY